MRHGRLCACVLFCLLLVPSALADFLPEGFCDPGYSVAPPPCESLERIPYSPPVDPYPYCPPTDPYPYYPPTDPYPYYPPTDPCVPAPQPYCPPVTQKSCARSGSACGYGVVRTNGGSLRLRAKPSTCARILGNYACGTVVNVLHWEGSWACVSVNGRVGYMHGAYIRM